MEDYGWRAKREAKPKSEPRQETPPDRQEPHYTAQDFSFWAFPRRRKTHEAQEPAAERTHEKV
jgi:hypothetical protein